MKITIEPTNQPVDTPLNYRNPQVSVWMPSDDMTIDELVEHMVKPLLIAWGFHSDTVNERLFPDDYEQAERDFEERMNERE